MPSSAKKSPWIPVATPPAMIGWYEVKGPDMRDGRVAWRFWNGSGWEWCFPRGGREGPTRATHLVPASQYFWRGVV